MPNHPHAQSLFTSLQDPPKHSAEISNPQKPLQNAERSQNTPLAYQMAPTTFEDYVGQPHLLGPNSPLKHWIKTQSLPSILLYGPPGCGKTALSKLITRNLNAHYIPLNAVTAKIADIKSAVDTAKAQARIGKKTILFIDEIHRFTKVQQDALLPDVENGLLTLIGATTENPYFSLTKALLSRIQILQLTPLSTDDLKILIQKACQNLNPSAPPTLHRDALTTLLAHVNGDARKAISLIETAYRSQSNTTEITQKTLETILQTTGVPHDEDDHYNIVSAFIKSMRGSDPDASVYWLARLIQGGEPPEFIARRLVIFASEDVGNADPHALTLATSTLTAVKLIGMPESRIILSQATTYLASAPKSNASYTAISSALSAIDDGLKYPVPLHLKDASYQGAKTMGHGQGYKYPHDYPNSYIPQAYLPPTTSFYTPKPIGYEATILTHLRTLTTGNQDAN